MTTACSISDCSTPKVTRGWCPKHYQRWRAYGDPEATKNPRYPAQRRGRPLIAAEERFWEKVNKTNECWLWTATLNRYGYGMIYVEKMRTAHRFAYELLVGPIPDTAQIDHLCRVRACVNPAHMELVTQTENVRRGASTKLTIEGAAEIRTLQGHVGAAEAAKRYGVSPALVHAIWGNRAWRE